MSDSENAVLKTRLERTRQEMERQGVDYLFVTPSSDLIYLLGYPAHSSERLTLLGVPRDGEPFVVVPTLESVRLAERRDIVDIHPWEETDSPTELVARLVEGAPGSAIAVSDQTWSGFLIKLQDELPDARFLSATPVLRELRMIKDEQEIENIRIASAKTDTAWENFVKTARITGLTEREAGEQLADLMAKEGLPRPTFMIVGSGPNSASPHYMTGDRVIEKGDAVVFDFGARWNHYTSDLTRTVYVGEPTEEYRKVYNIVLEANRAAYAAVKPGVACQEIDRAARKVIDDAGYGEYFIHRVGHGLGLDGHEEPYMVEGNDLPLKPGMVFSDEPGIYMAGKFGVRVEDILLCTESGAESFNHCDRELTTME
jgi:Xaa-Pro aminopeptidase